MLHIVVPKSEFYDETKNQFITNSEKRLTLEHSLVSISKWESKYHKLFISNVEKSYEETIDYIKFMTITQNVDDEVYTRLTLENVDSINKYIDNPMTASTVPETKGTTSREKISSELIYYWMIALNIPFECQKWHLNRLLMLIRICSAKNTTPKKRSKKQMIQDNARLNAANRKKYNSKG